MFVTQDALDKFRTTDKGWTAGVDGSVAVAKTGANGSLDTATTEFADRRFRGHELRPDGQPQL